MGFGWQQDLDRITWTDVPICNDDSHDASLPHNRTSLVPAQSRCHQALPKSVELTAWVPQPGNPKLGGRSDPKHCARGQPKKIDRPRQDVVANIARTDDKALLRQLLKKFRVQQMNLTQVGLLRVTQDAGAVLYGRAEVRIAFHTEASQQPDPHPWLLAEPVRAALADRFDESQHQNHSSGLNRAAGPPFGKGTNVGQTEPQPNRRPAMPSIPIGIHSTDPRTETDSMGAVEVPGDRYWGAQTQRSLHHFAIGDDRMPKELSRAYGIVKKAAAEINLADGRLAPDKAEAIIAAADEVISGKLDPHFPLYVWQTGSGTQSNMNLNEVISNRAIQLLGGTVGSKSPVHPNDDVNMCQSSNDTFPTAMHLATVQMLDGLLLPRIGALAGAIEDKARQWMEVVKIGRTHLEDAVPLTVGQEWSGYAHQLRDAISDIEASKQGLYELAAGGTAVGTGITAPRGFSEKIAARIAALTGKPFITAPNKFAAQGSLDAMTRTSAALRGLAVALMKIANDMRWLASGPRCGLGELLLPDNEPGSSIMPGKVNPTQCEAVVMICIEVIGEDTAVAFAGSQGNFELNTMRPIIINNVLHCARILADGAEKFRLHSVQGTRLNEKRISQYVNESVMLVTALSPVIGYDKASDIAHTAMRDDLTLRQAALDSGAISGEDFDRLVDPRGMVGEGLSGS